MQGLIFRFHIEYGGPLSQTYLAVPQVAVFVGCAGWCVSLASGYLTIVREPLMPSPPTIPAPIMHPKRWSAGWRCRAVRSQVRMAVWQRARVGGWWGRTLFSIRIVTKCLIFGSPFFWRFGFAEPAAPAAHATAASRAAAPLRPRISPR